MMVAGKANSFADPYCTKRNAAMMRSMLRKYGAQEHHRAPTLTLLMVPSEKF
jgi:hypothetical protein